MSLDISLMNKLEGCEEYVEVWSANITHNVARMARAAGLYDVMWDSNDKKSRDIKPLLILGIKELKDNPEKYKAMNPSNGWGSYEHLLFCAENFLSQIKKYPASEISSSR